MFFAETASAVFSTFTLFGPIAPLYFNELGFSKSFSRFCPFSA